MKKSMLRSINCAALNEYSLPCGKLLVKSDSFCDEAGYYWCEEHKKRGWLMNYGVRHKYPAIHFGKFAIGDGKDADLWKIVVVMGSEEMINAAVASLGLTGDDEHGEVAS